MSAADLTVFEQLAFCTLRIECELSGGGISTGTGFFFRFGVKGGESIPCLVTNKHVIKGATNGNLIFTYANPDGSPAIGKKFHWKFGNFEGSWLAHPDADVDLAILPIAPLMMESEAKGVRLFFKSFDSSLFLTDEETSDLIGFERIVMIGYPNGIWDEKNNFPVFRTGVTATNFKYDWNGRSEFLIDAACFPGSSGSPVMICDVGSYQTKKGTFAGATRIKFIGVLYAGPQHTVTGKVEIVPIQHQVVSVAAIPNNLGMVIKSNKLLDFEAVLKRVIPGRG